MWQQKRNTNFQIQDHVKLSPQMYNLGVECVYLLLREEEDTLGNAEYLFRGERVLQPQILHHSLASLQNSHVRAVGKEVIFRNPSDDQVELGT